jgi:hypothetical protein
MTMGGSKWGWQTWMSPEVFVNVILGGQTDDIRLTEAGLVDCLTAEEEYGL